MYLYCVFVCSSRRRQTRCALVTGVQTCALPICFDANGAYTAAILTSFHANWPLLLSLPFAVAITTVSGILLGWPTLRIRGDYLAIVTLGFGEIIRLTARSEEHTSELQSLMRISYAVFCLKKKIHMTNELQYLIHHYIKHSKSSPNIAYPH